MQINDSKQLTATKREELRRYIEEHAVAFNVEYADTDEIEEKNILHATIAAMHRCVRNLRTEPDNLVVDGNHFKQYTDKNGIIIPIKQLKKEILSIEILLLHLFLQRFTMMNTLLKC